MEVTDSHWEVFSVGMTLLDLWFCKVLIDSMKAGVEVVKSGVCEIKQWQWAWAWCLWHGVASEALQPERRNGI